MILMESCMSKFYFPVSASHICACRTKGSKSTDRDSTGRCFKWPENYCSYWFLAS